MNLSRNSRVHKQELTEEAFAKTVDEVAMMPAKAWKVSPLQQAYFIEVLCMGPMLSHRARGTDLQEDNDAFLTE